MSYSCEFVNQIYNLPKTPEAVSNFLNSYYDEKLPNGKIHRRQMWERFEGSYVKVTKHYERGTDDDEGDVYIYAHKLVSRCVLAPVAPYFESDGQLFSYFQLMVKNSRINESVKRDKQAFALVGDLACEGNETITDSDYANFEEMVLSGDPVTEVDVYKDGGLGHVLEIFEELGDKDLLLLGRLFVENNYSFDGLQGLCGFGSQKFRDLKKKFVSGLRAYYAIR